MVSLVKPTALFGESICHFISTPATMGGYPLYRLPIIPACTCIYLRQDWVFHLCVLAVRVVTTELGVPGLWCSCACNILTTGLGVTGLMFLLNVYSYILHNWVLQACCSCCTCTYHRTGSYKLGWRCPRCPHWCHQNSWHPHWRATGCYSYGFVSACRLHTSRCRYPS